jgi:hypothetical protein
MIHSASSVSFLRSVASSGEDPSTLSPGKEETFGIRRSAFGVQSGSSPFSIDLSIVLVLRRRRSRFF